MGAHPRLALATVLSVALLCRGTAVLAGEELGPIVPEGETVEDVGQVMAAVTRRTPVRALAFNPNGHLLASALVDHQLRLWDADSGQHVWDLATGADAAILAAGQRGLWIACKPAVHRCWRRDDGTLLSRTDEHGAAAPVAPPRGTGPVRLSVGAVRSAGPLVAAEGGLTPLSLRVRNRGKDAVFWVRVQQQRALGDPLLYLPPPVYLRLDPGQSVDLTGQVSYRSSQNGPQRYSATLRLQVEHAHGSAGMVEVPVRATAAGRPPPAGPDAAQAVPASAR